MSKSKQQLKGATQAPRRRVRSLFKKVLDNERNFIDDLLHRTSQFSETNRAIDLRLSWL